MNAIAAYFAELSGAFGDGWNRFWFAPRDARLLCLLRILTGLLATYYVASHTADLIRWFGPHGLLPVDTVRQLTSGPAGEFNFRPSYLNHITAPGAFWTVHLAALAVTIAFAAGLFARVTNVLTLAVVLAYVHRGPMISGQFEPVLTMLLAYLLLAPSGQCLSVDAWWRGGVPAEGLSSVGGNIALRLIQVHTCGFYALMGLTMLSGQVWWSGEAVWWLIARPDSRPLDLTGLAGSLYAINFWTHATVAMALVFPLLVWNRLARPLLLCAAAVFWSLLALLTGLLPFAAAMAVATLSFLPQRPVGFSIQSR